MTDHTRAGQGTRARAQAHKNLVALELWQALLLQAAHIVAYKVKACKETRDIKSKWNNQ